MKSRYWWLLGIAAVLLAVLLLLLRLPRPFDTDLTQVGTGRPAVVLVHDHNFVQSGNLQNALNAVRGDYESRALFLMADQNREAGLRFAHEQGLTVATLVLFAGDGTQLAVFNGALLSGTDEAAVRRWLNEQLP